jgi:UDP-glucose 4-epimerase
MRIAVIGASGNVGTSTLSALGADPAVDSILGVARRLPDLEFPKTDWAAADVSASDLRPLLAGVDAVIHLAWLIQPGRCERMTFATNVEGSRRVFEAARAAGVKTLVYASSVGAYSPGPKRPVDESWPTDGIPTSFYSRHKARVERMLDDFEREAPETRVVRLRPALIFKRDAAAEVRRLFAGPFLPGRLVGRLPIVPLPKGLVTQAVHSADVGEAYRLAALNEHARGAFNVAADPVLGPRELAAALGGRPMPASARVLRGAARLTFSLRLQPSEPGWFDMGMRSPLLDMTRAREVLGWQPRHRADAALDELVSGLRQGCGLETPPLSPSTGGPLRLGEILTGVGAR